MQQPTYLPHVAHVSTVFATANDLRHNFAHRHEIQHSLIERMSSGYKLSTEEERTEILDHIAENTRPVIYGKLCEDVKD